MLNLPWYVWALAAALAWGIHYPLVDNALKKLSLPGVLLLTALPILILVPFFARELAQDAHLLRASNWSQRLWLLAPALSSLAGSALLFSAIANKNATLASLIEVSYPAFVALFAWLLFRELHVTPSALLGGGLVIAGVVLIASSNP